MVFPLLLGYYGLYLKGYRTTIHPTLNVNSTISFTLLQKSVVTKVLVSKYGDTSDVVFIQLTTCRMIFKFLPYRIFVKSTRSLLSTFNCTVKNNDD